MFLWFAGILAVILLEIDVISTVIHENSVGKLSSCMVVNKCVPEACCFGLELAAVERALRKIVQLLWKLRPKANFGQLSDLFWSENTKNVQFCFGVYNVLAHLLATKTLWFWAFGTILSK